MVTDNISVPHANNYCRAPQFPFSLSEMFQTSSVQQTLSGRLRYPLCGGCRCQTMQLMGSLKLAPKGMRCNGSGGLYGRGRRSIQSVDQPLLTVTPFQKATRPRISAAAALGSG
jgi:hypothetical protein